MAHPVNDVAFFMHLGGQAFPEDTDRSITPADIRKFLARLDEEFIETHNAAHWREAPGADAAVNIPEALDGFIDAAYVALTGAIRLVGPRKAAKAWDAVVDANLAKVDGRFGPPIINEETGKIGKPAGWTAPDIEAIVNA